MKQQNHFAVPLRIYLQKWSNKKVKATEKLLLEIK